MQKKSGKAGTAETTDGAQAAVLTQDQLAEQIARIAASKDRKAFAEIFNNYAPRLKSYLIGLNASGAQAEELVQDVMLTVWTKAHLFENHKGSPSAWIFTIARNRYIDEIRKSSKPAIDPYEFELTLPETKNSDEIFELKELSDRLEDSLSQLPEEQAQVVRMCFLEGKSHNQISQELEIPLGTVKSRSRLAFARLRSTLEDLRQ